MGCKGYKERVTQAASLSLTDHWHCHCQHPFDCSAAAVPLGMGQGSVLGAVLACGVALIWGREAERELADFSPLPCDSDESRWCILMDVDFHVSPPSCAQIGFYGDEVSNLLHHQGCK